MHEFCAAMDSDDDFGDFTSVPADALQVMHVPLNSAPLDFVATSLSNPSHVSLSGTSIGDQYASSIKPIESNSDDDWGDFVEHTSSALWDNSMAFDWFAAPQHSAGQSSSPEAFTSGYDNDFLPRKEELEVQHANQKSGNLQFDDIYFSAGTCTSSLKGSEALSLQVHYTDGSCVDNNEIAAEKTTPFSKRNIFEQKIGSEQESFSKEIKFSPIPLSLFGVTEVDAENAKAQLVDIATNPFQGFNRNIPISTSPSLSGNKDFSNWIVNLYTEAQPLSKIRSTNTVALNEHEKSTSMVDSLLGYQSSAAGGLDDLDKSMFALSLGLKHASETGFSKGDMLVTAGAELQLKDAATSLPLDSLSKGDQCAFVEVWASILAVCASELELASKIWKQARGAGVHLALLADPQGKRYFAAIGQIYIVALILAATSNVYKPWLHQAAKKGENLCADLERCKAVWLETNLKEGVRLALDELEGCMPTSVISWRGVECFSTVALEAYLLAARASSVQSFCKICLLPTAPFSCKQYISKLQSHSTRDTGLHSIEWSGSCYLLPLANLWANCVSQKPPSTCLSS